jgi:hypothetical protein
MILDFFIIACKFVDRILLFTFILLACIYILTILDNIGKYFANLKEKVFQEMIKLRDENEGTTSSAMEQFNFSVGILDLVDRMIVIEIEKVIAGYSQLNKRYEVSRLDVDIKHVSEVVSNAIRKEVFLSSDMIISSDYVIKTITERTTHLLISSVKEYNKNFLQITPLIDDNQ